ncbi:anti-sigma factor [Pantoea sp. S61]|uniref:anti-sigma factor n=1 Tax=Pantoea sp. S61 TaxID=2767442 RepID=UPI001909F5A2|nr:anti-sigma factor [Pantoea sp. S61]MBK0122484.1 anti-sigma factor [Pantoea sp. S61]MBK0122807.1 anti-sigma factor [Pantoea sp. S61]
MKNNKHDDALAAEYALGTLRGNARLRFERRLQQEPELAAKVASWQTMLAGMDTHLRPEIPPERVWKKIALSLPAKTPVKRANPYVGWLVAAGLAAFTLVSYYSHRPDEFAPLVILGDSQHQGQWVVSRSSDRRYLQLSPLKPVAINASRSLQLWLIPAGQSPVSLGLLADHAATQIEMDNRALAAGATLAISLEPQGGSPTGQPTGPVLYSGML